MATEEKKVFAKVGETIFTYISTGKWEATLFDREIVLTRLNAIKWECRDKFNHELLGTGSTRNEAMREAFFEQSVIRGYDEHEAVRLDWVLEEQKYRSYGGHRPRKKSTKKTKASQSAVVDFNKHKSELAEQQAKDEHGNIHEPMNDPSDRAMLDASHDAAFALERLKRGIEHYRTAYNETLGGFVFYERDDQGRMVGQIQGPFESEKALFESILINEISKL